MGKISTSLPFQNSDMFWKPTEAVVGDVATFLRDLSAGLAGYQCDSEWLSTLHERDEAKEQDNMKVSFYHLCQRRHNKLDKNICIKYLKSKEM